MCVVYHTIYLLLVLRTYDDDNHEWVYHPPPADWSVKRFLVSLMISKLPRGAFSVRNCCACCVWVCLCRAVCGGALSSHIIKKPFRSQCLYRKWFCIYFVLPLKSERSSPINTQASHLIVIVVVLLLRSMLLLLLYYTAVYHHSGTWYQTTTPYCCCMHTTQQPLCSSA